MTRAWQEAARPDTASDQLAPDDPLLAAQAVAVERSSELLPTVMMTMNAPTATTRSRLDGHDARLYTNHLKTQPHR